MALFLSVAFCVLAWVAALLSFGRAREARRVYRQNLRVLDAIGDLAEHVVKEIEEHGVVKTEAPHRN